MCWEHTLEKNSKALSESQCSTPVPSENVRKPHLIHLSINLSDEVNFLCILGVPGKLDHVSIVAYEVGCMAPKLSSPKADTKTAISPVSSFDMVEDYVPSKF